MNDVTWAGPLVRAEKQLRDAGELLERRKRSEGLDALAAVQREISLAVEILLREEAAK